MQNTITAFEQINDLLRWKKQATREKWEKLAKLANTSVGNLDQLAYGWRGASAKKASDIANATLNFRDPKPVTKEAIAFAPVRKVQKDNAA
ncbi:transcriptional regulator [Erwinia sp. AnSW2-5]|uniref:transcriptional regulator n=1 Tax=Erwinia sp. AnSW2-5 TaxID=3367692 RepID=UPI00385BE0BD